MKKLKKKKVSVSVQNLKINENLKKNENFKIIDFFIKFLILILFSAPFLLFLKNVTINPYLIQKIIFICVSTLIFLCFVIKQLFSDFKFSINQPGKKFFSNLVPAEKILFSFFFVCAISFIVAFFKFPDWKLAILLEGEEAFVLLIFNTIFAYFAPFFVDSKNFENILWRTIFLTGILASIYGIFQFFDIELFWLIEMKKFGKRSVSTFGNPNFLSSFLMMLIPIGIYFAYYKKKFGEKLFYLISVIIFFAALICAMTRSSWLGLFLGLTFYAIFFVKLKLKLKQKNFKFYYKNKKSFALKFTLFFALIFILTLCFLPFLKNRLKESINFSPENKSIFQRILIWKSSKDMFFDNKIIGVGWGFFETVYPFYQSKYLENKKFIAHQTHANNAHNEFLEILTQTGIAGFLLYVSFFISIFILAIKCFQKNEDEKQKMLFIAYFASIFAMFSDNMLNNSLHIASTMTLFWFIVGNLIKNVKLQNFNFKNENEWKNVSETKISAVSKKIFLLMILGIFIFFSIRQIKFFIAQKYYFKSYFLLDGKENPSSILLLEARELLEKSRKFQKYEVNKLYEMGKVATKLKLFDEAIKCYSAAILANPSYYEFYFSRGIIHYRNNSLENAKNDFEKSYKINPKNIEIIYAIFSVFLKQKNYEECLKYFKKGEILEPKNYHIVSAIGAIYSYLKDFKNAKIYYEKALKINPNFKLAKDNLKKLENNEPGNFTIFEFK